MKWFMSYVRVSFDGALTFCHSVQKTDRHPIKAINDWNETHAKDEKSRYILLSFQQVGDECPDADEMGRIHF